MCVQHARPVNLNPGQAHLFHQEHIHGNVNNTTGKCRLAIDWHLLPKGEPHGRRLPGGFFKLPGDYGEVQDVPKDGRYVGYVGNNTKFDYKIPQRFQRSIIDEYCAEIGIRMQRKKFEDQLYVINEKNYNYINILSAYVGTKLMQKYPADYIYNKYRDKQIAMCDQLRLEPSPCVYFGIDKQKKYQEYNRGTGTNRLCFSRVWDGRK